MNYKLTIAYEGTHYHGWQIQLNGISVQSLIEKALYTITREKIRLIGSGRTDAGVHALAQVAHLKTAHNFQIERALYSLNSLLPQDIRVMKIEEAADSFHAQHDALSKVYRYHLYLNKILSPFKRPYVWHIPWQQFDLGELSRGIPYFLGTHNFTSFANEPHRGVASHDPIRNISRIDIVHEEGGVALEFEADGFLYKMVRNIVGMLVDCALGKRLPEEIPEVIHAEDRKKGGMAAPPQGLFLVRVNYPS